MKESLIKNTKYGKIRGTTNEYADVYMNIPFAKPPVGPLTFKAPVEPDKWEGILDCTKPGPNPIQHVGKFGVPNQSLDCLYAYIFVPKGVTGKLPVMVWIYGGAYANGGVGLFDEKTGQLYYDMSLFANDTKTIVVCFNYRVNVYGFMNFHYLDESFDLNNGLLDQILALKFVKENITEFGGDDNNITIFGQSAGGSSVMNLMSVNETKGLFNKAIVESPCIDHYFTYEESQKLTKKFLKYAKIKDLHELYNIDTDRLTTAIDKAEKWLLAKGDVRCFFSPIIDGKYLKDYPAKEFNNSDVPLLIGYTSNECDLFMDEYPAIILPFISLKAGIKARKEEGPYRKRLSDGFTDEIYIKPITAAAKSYKSDS